MRTQRWWQTGLAFWQSIRLAAGKGTSTNALMPILNQAQIHELGRTLSLMPLSSMKNPLASEAKKQGEQASHYLGSGLEYEESRLYQPGDEVRRIHWRLFAKTGQAYTKLFQEERQQSWTLLVDQRASMRFGTQRQLKVTQALNVAGYFAWQAQQSGINMDAIRLADQVYVSPIYEGRGLFEHILHFLAVPCPPVDSRETPVRLLDELLDCQQRLTSGSSLMIISDLADLDEATLYALAALQQKVWVQVVLIVDPAEMALKQVSGLKLMGLNGQFLTLSDAQQAEYNRWAHQYFAGKTRKLAEIGVTHYTLSTTDELMALYLQIQQGFSGGSRVA